LGVALGLVGIALLALPDGTLGGGVTPVGFLVLLGSTLAWAGGSLYSRQLDPHPVPLGATGMEMMAGGLFLLVASAGAGEWSGVDLSGITARGVFSIAYLIVFGS